MGRSLLFARPIEVVLRGSLKVNDSRNGKQTVSVAKIASFFRKPAGFDRTEILSVKILPSASSASTIGYSKAILAETSPFSNGKVRVRCADSLDNPFVLF